MENGIFEVDNGESTLNVGMMIMGAMIQKISSDVKSGELALDDELVLNTFYPCFQDFSFEFMRAINMKLNEKDETARRNISAFIDECERMYIAGGKDLEEFKNKQALGGL